MIFLATLVVAVLFLPWPWNLVVIALAAVWELGLAVLGLRWTRRGPVAVGAETLLGRDGEVVSSRGAAGQVRVDGELWEARIALQGGDKTLLPGGRVRVTGRDGLTLSVEPAEKAR